MTKDMSTTDKVSTDTNKLFSLRDKLHRKAKQEPNFRFYALYSHIYREDTLYEAWRRVRKNNGSPGADGISFKSIENSDEGVDGFLREIQKSLRDKTYRPSPVLRVTIDKPGGGHRHLGIPTIRDRVVQMACFLILEPIYDADFENCSYGFRTGRSTKDAVSQVRKHLRRGFNGVYDADISGFFDNINHEKLLEFLEQRIVDRSVLRLIRYWLRCPIVDVDKGSGKKRYRYPKKGTPQGGVISPLLANIYLHEFDRETYGSGGKLHQFNARLVRYADDFVILARYIGRPIELLVKHILENKLWLELNPIKTHILNLKKDGASFDFLGFTFRYDEDLHGGTQDYLIILPSKKALNRAKSAIRELTRSWNKGSIEEVIARINRFLRGWGNYFEYGYPRRVFRKLNWYVVKRLTVFMKHRSQRTVRKRKHETWYRYLIRNGLKLL